MSNLMIDGILFDKMIRNGLNNLRNKEQEINDLNVFPVPDGDTGTNMRLTLEHGINNTFETDNLGVYLKSLGKGMLMGARGNSGVIFSQLINGFSTELSSNATCNSMEFASGLVSGYKKAYSTVLHPVEGTILTVAREGAENIKSHITNETDIESFLEKYIIEMGKSLAKTPEKLDVLKEANVIDSGAAGYLIVFEGMYSFLKNELIESDVLSLVESVSQPQVDDSLFGVDSDFIDGYCMEFLLQLLNSKVGSSGFSINEYISKLEKLGESIVAVKDEDRVKVHIHTFKPSPVIELSQEYGEFVTFKLENMQIQHNERDEKIEKKSKTIARTPLSIIAVSNGDGVSTFLQEFSCCNVIKCNDTMNTSSEEFIEALSQTNSDKVLIMPNNKNVLSAANQAVELSRMDNVEVIPTNSVVDCYFSIAMDNPMEENLEKRINSIKDGVGMANCVSIAKSIKDCISDGVNVSKDDYIAVLDGEVVYSAQNLNEVISNGISRIDDLDDKECCIIFYGKDITEEDAESVAELIELKNPMIESQVIYGGQSVYDWIIGLS